MSRDLPEPGELVVVTIKEVKNFGATAKLEEYPGHEGFIHIAEVATGWVKHIRDYLREGQKTVCKVLSIDTNRGNVELHSRGSMTTRRGRKSLNGRMSRRQQSFLR